MGHELPRRAVARTVLLALVAGALGGAITALAVTRMAPPAERFLTEWSLEPFEPCPPVIDRLPPPVYRTPRPIVEWKALTSG